MCIRDSPSLANLLATVPPALLSLIVPVNGLLAPIDILPEHGALVPANKPGAITILLSLPNGLHNGFTSCLLYTSRCV